MVATLIQVTDSTGLPTASTAATLSVSAFRTEICLVGESYAHALLSIVRRAPEYAENENKAMDLLSRTLTSLFEAPAAISHQTAGKYSSLQIVHNGADTKSVIVHSTIKREFYVISNNENIYFLNIILVIGGITKKSKLSSLYYYSNTHTRFLLLDVFAHTPFEDVLAAAKVVFNAMSSYVVSLDEQKYLLRIAFER